MQSTTLQTQPTYAILRATMASSQPIVTSQTSGMTMSIAPSTSAGGVSSIISQPQPGTPIMIAVSNASTTSVVSTPAASETQMETQTPIITSTPSVVLPETTVSETPPPASQ